MSNTHKKSTFFGGAAILAVGTIIVKLIGAVYKIPLVDILGESAYGDFNAAYNIYSLFLTISTAGLPVALSKTISEANALGRQNQVQRIFRVAFVTFLTLGLISFLCMSVFAKPLTPLIVNNKKAVWCVIALSPSVLCVCVMSSFRGYAQGHANMLPTTVSQIIESATKLIIGIGLAMALVSLGKGQDWAAVGAIFAISIGSVLALGYLVVTYFRGRRAPARRATDVPDAPRTIFSNLLRLAVPITLGSAAVAIVTLIDTNLVMFQLKDIFAGIQSGALTGDSEIFTKSVAIFHSITQAALTDPKVDVVLDSARRLYGTYSSTMTVYNLPAAFMVPLTASVIPAVASCRARHDRLGSSKISESALRVGALLCLPMGIGLFALGSPIVRLLFRSLDVSIAGPLLSTLGLASIFVCIMLICNSILQANGMVNLPIVTVVIGGIVKLIVNWFLVGNPRFMIFGAPVGTLCCFAIVSVLELFIIHRVIPSPPRYTMVFVKPLIAAVLMGGSAWGTHFLLTHFLQLGNTLATVGAIGVGVVVYLVLVLALQVISKEDLDLMPKGDKIAKFLHIQ